MTPKTPTPETAFWIGIDLDGTLAQYNGWKGIEHIGEPILPVLNHVKQLLAQGKRVKIFTARVDGGQVAVSSGNKDGEAHKDVSAVRRHIEAWLIKHIGQTLEITNVKDYGMIELWDDRAVQVVPNTGETLQTKIRNLEQERDKSKGELALYRQRVEGFSEQFKQKIERLEKELEGAQNFIKNCTLEVKQLKKESELTKRSGCLLADYQELQSQLANMREAWKWLAIKSQVLIDQDKETVKELLPFDDGIHLPQVTLDLIEALADWAKVEGGK